ncbi:4Fe-4S binding protein [Geovibrio ferrireducens]|uniref:4Fe-4S binding protein n=1 Tax=Geovibrio ferrireducens TaxID=46201 RepID=UPI002246ABF1|nr:4Fe-4S binding protein [Geovibrio ferrireducens]
MKRLHMSKYRMLFLAGGVIVITAAFFIGAGTGTYCTLCPLGFMQVTAASGSVPFGMLSGVLAAIAAVLVLGRFFCGWFCPTTLVRKLFGSNANKHSSPEKSVRHAEKLPLLIAAAAVGLSFVAGFPIFCLVCPIGIFFGLIFAVLKMLFVFEPGWNLIIFPAILAAEVLIFRRWCSSVCPVSAVFSLVSKIPFVRFRPVLHGSQCISANGGVCSGCVKACHEGINVKGHDETMETVCTSCMECIDSCPTKSLVYARDKSCKNSFHIYSAPVLRGRTVQTDRNQEDL